MTELQWQTGALADGLQRYRTGRFFAAHEAWEGVWLQAPEPHKTLLQALIQIAAAHYHLQRNNTRGAITLLTAARERLGRFPTSFGGVCIGSLRVRIGERLRALNAGGSAADLDPVSIQTY